MATKPGGVGHAKPVTDEVVDICTSVKEQIEEKTGSDTSVLAQIPVNIQARVS
jgi:hypothetical protein